MGGITPVEVLAYLLYSVVLHAKLVCMLKYFKIFLAVLWPVKIFYMIGGSTSLHSKNHKHLIQILVDIFLL